MSESSRALWLTISGIGLTLGSGCDSRDSSDGFLRIRANHRSAKANRPRPYVGLVKYLFSTFAAIVPIP